MKKQVKRINKDYQKIIETLTEGVLIAQEDGTEVLMNKELGNFINYSNR